ncbi:OsmC family protein [Dongia deserti]|uniref:OsmC family protein n=1 Tax=Dongia deserti TaxID=2268030 RepID=UPI000E65E019|nr:OsmC family protein [Dongia deserti]
MAHAYRATVLWRRGDQAFTDNRYSRGHVWRFDEGLEVPASSSPFVVPNYSITAAVDPEEAFVASLSSCHLLFFLTFAARAGFTIDSYEDEARGEMAKNEAGKLYVARVTLHPTIVFSGDKRPSEADIAALHHRSHEECFIANSVKTEVVTEIVPPQFV